MAEYFLFRSGPLATVPHEVGVFARSGPDVDRPDIQLFMGGFTMAESADGVAVPTAGIAKIPGMTISGCFVRATSEGSISIASPDPDVPLTIHPNWLSTEEDCRSAVALVRFVRKLVSQPALARYIAQEFEPGLNGNDSDEAIVQAVRRNLTCGTHAVATCRMGSDNAAVVDPRARVLGVEGLRVVDCSIMPSLTSGNTNAPAMATAWHAASLILQDAAGKQGATAVRVAASA